MTNMQRSPSRGRTLYRSPLPPSPPLSFQEKYFASQTLPHISEDHSGICQSFTLDKQSEEQHLNYPLFTPLLDMDVQAEDVFTLVDADKKFATEHVEHIHGKKVFNKFANADLWRPYLPFSGVVHEKARFEQLPTEIFDQIIPLLYDDTSVTSGFRKRNHSLVCLLRVSKTIHHAALATLYKRVNFSQSRVFAKFLEHIKKYPYLGTLVRRIDFSHFTSIGQGRSAADNKIIPYVTGETLTQCLMLTPNLQEFMGCETLGPDLTSSVLYTLFESLPYLAAVDFCAASAPEFVAACLELCVASRSSDFFFQDKLPMKRVGFHDCSTLPPIVFHTLLPVMPLLTHLDLSHTPIHDDTLCRLPETARLTHLSLSKCYKLTGNAVVEFLVTHPAVNSTLKVLLLHYDTTRYQLLDHNNVTELLSNLPQSLISLNITGASINSAHMPLVLHLLPQLEELSIGGADISLMDLNSMVAPLAKSKLKYLDLSDVAIMTPANLLYTVFCFLLLPSSKPLEVIEFNEKMSESLKERDQACKRLGWTVKAQGRRAWLVRNGPASNAYDEERARSRSRNRCYSTFLGRRRLSCDHDLLDGRAGVGTEDGIDDGSRDWKRGGKWWGARKINLAWGEIGGIYGYYGFGK